MDPLRAKRDVRVGHPSPWGRALAARCLVVATGTPRTLHGGGLVPLRTLRERGHLR